MNYNERSAYTQYIAKCLREAEEITELKWPDETILCIQWFHALAELDKIVGLDIYPVDIPSEQDIFTSFPAKYYNRRKLLKEFRAAINYNEVNFNNDH